MIASGFGDDRSLHRITISSVDSEPVIRTLDYNLIPDGSGQHVCAAEEAAIPQLLVDESDVDASSCCCCRELGSDGVFVQRCPHFLEIQSVQSGLLSSSVVPDFAEDRFRAVNPDRAAPEVSNMRAREFTAMHLSMQHNDASYVLHAFLA